MAGMSWPMTCGGVERVGPLTRRHRVEFSDALQGSMWRAACRLSTNPGAAGRVRLISPGLRAHALSGRKDTMAA